VNAARELAVQAMASVVYSIFTNLPPIVLRG